MTAEPSAADVKRSFSPQRFASGSAHDHPIVKAELDQENRRQQQHGDDDDDDVDVDEEDDGDIEEDDDEEEDEDEQPLARAAKLRTTAATTKKKKKKKPRQAKVEADDDDDDKKNSGGGGGADGPATASGTKKSRRELPPHTVAILKGWMLSPEHVKHPYPTDEDKQTLLKKTGINMKQLTNWFTNARKRIWKPMMRREHSRQLQSAIEYEKTRPPPPPFLHDGEFPVGRSGGPSVVRHSFDAGSLGPLRQQQQLPPPPGFDPYAPRGDGRELPPPVYAPPGFVPRVVRSVSEALPGAARVDDDYMDAMRIRKRVHERSPDGVEVDTTSGQDKRYRRSSPLLSPRSLKILQDWVATHPDFPFPTDPEKLQLSRDTGLDVQQIELWFTTNRERISAANFAVQNGAPGLSPSRRQLPGRSIPSRDNPMFPPPMYSASSNEHPHARRSIPSSGNPMFPPRPTTASMQQQQQRSSIPGNGNPQYPPPPALGRREGPPDGYYAPPPMAYGSGYAGHGYSDPSRHVRSMSISSGQLMQRPLMGGAGPSQGSTGAPLTGSGLPSLTQRSGMPHRVANVGGPTMGQPRDGRSHTLDMGLFTDARRRKMNFQDILASTTTSSVAVAPSARPQLSIHHHQVHPQQPLSGVGMVETGSHPSSGEQQQVLHAYPTAGPSYAVGVQSFERPHISGCPRCGARPGTCGCGAAEDAQQQQQQRRIV